MHSSVTPVFESGIMIQLSYYFSKSHCGASHGSGAELIKFRRRRVALKHFQEPEHVRTQSQFFFLSVIKSN